MFASLPCLVLHGYCGYWRDCFDKVTLMNLHVDMSIYGVWLFMTDALNFFLFHKINRAMLFQGASFLFSVYPEYQCCDLSHGYCE